MLTSLVRQDRACGYRPAKISRLRIGRYREGGPLLPVGRSPQRAQGLPVERLAVRHPPLGSNVGVLIEIHLPFHETWPNRPHNDYHVSLACQFGEEVAVTVTQGCRDRCPGERVILGVGGAGRGPARIGLPITFPFSRLISRFQGNLTGISELQPGRRTIGAHNQLILQR